MIRRRHLLIPVWVAALVAVLAFNGASGTFLFAHSKVDSLARADAIVVLGGEHDGRENYGLELAEQGYAPTVLLSNPYPAKDKVMKKACRPRTDIEVLCRAPLPSTTRGEAMMTRELAELHGWQKIIVISWRYHLPRARRIFDQCLAASPREVIMRDVPRDYTFSVAQWQYTYLYQYGGWAKAELISC